MSIACPIGHAREKTSGGRIVWRDVAPQDSSNPWSLENWSDSLIKNTPPRAVATDRKLESRSRACSSVSTRAAGTVGEHVSAGGALHSRRHCIGRIGGAVNEGLPVRGARHLRHPSAVVGEHALYEQTVGRSGVVRRCRASSADRRSRSRFGGHGESALVVGRPQLGAGAVGATVDGERVRQEQRAFRAVGELAQRPPLAGGQVERAGSRSAGRG